MLIEITKQTAIRGRAVRPGDRVDVDEPDARQLLGMGRAKRVADSLPVVVSDQPAVVPAEEPAPEERKPRHRKPRAT
jgi:hypothetical protein